MALYVNDLTSKQLEDLWDTGEGFRSRVAKLRRYYNGIHAIVGQNAKYADGSKKSECVTNWIAYIIDRYVGAITEHQLTVEDSTDDEDAIDDVVRTTISEIRYNATRFGEVAQNMRLRRHALLYGRGVELHWWDPVEKAPRFTVYDPDEWVFLKDENDLLEIAIRVTSFPKGSLYRGRLLESDLDVMYAFDSVSLTEFEKVRGENGKPEWVRTLGPIPHYYGSVPVIEWYVNEGRTSIISDALISQNDEYNEIDSASGDEIRGEVESILKITGIDVGNIAENADLIRRLRILALPDSDSDADYLTRNFDTTRVDVRLNRCREQIHIMGQVPDVSHIVGSTGATSGIALKLMFTPMQQAAEAYISNLEIAFRRRVELFSQMWKRANLPFRLEEFYVQTQFKIPVNRIEEWQNIGSLDGQVSHRTRLELLTDIEDPEAEMAAIQKERETTLGTERLQEPTSPEAQQQKAAENDAVVAKTATAISTNLEEILMKFSEQVAQATGAALKKVNLGGTTG